MCLILQHKIHNTIQQSQYNIARVLVLINFSQKIKKAQ
jgi:hypothetical protein